MFRLIPLALMLSFAAQVSAAEPTLDLKLFDGETPFGLTLAGPAKVAGGKLTLGPGPASAVTTARLPSGTVTLTADGATRTLAIADTSARLEVKAGETLTIDTWTYTLDAAKAQSLFNGKNLEGWSEHPGKKSRFRVTSEGWLNVADGPGDLQTVGKYQDFLFQCRCVSNGDFLNSGIFFRALPGQYQQGYEAQIRNQWLGARTIPVDYGTGAIYRRQPARKVVSSDRQWFTLTVLADGPRLRTWVDGYPVADWLDERPAAANARQGRMTGPGALSIQGHDLTTDLSFRDLRVLEMPGR